MRSQASLAETAAGNSPPHQEPGTAQSSAQQIRANATSPKSGRDLAQTASPTVTREGVRSALAAVLSAEATTQATDAAAWGDVVDRSVDGLQPAYSAPAMVTALAEEEALDAVVTNAEQFVSEAIRAFSTKQLTPEELPLPSAEQFLAKSIGQIAVETQGNRAVEAALDGKAGFVPHFPPLLPDGAAVDANVIAFAGGAQDAVASGDRPVHFLQEAAAKFVAGEVRIGVTPNIPAPVSDGFLAGDALIRGQPEEIPVPAAALPTESSNGPSTALPVESAANVTGIVREQLVEQIVRGVHMMQHNETTEIIVQLKPDFLGKVSIRVLADHHAMRLEIRAEHAAVRQVMQDNLADLQQRLSDKGLAFEQFNVLADTGMNSQREPDWHFGFPSNARSNASLKIAEEPPTEQRVLAATGAIDYFA